MRKVTEDTGLVPPALAAKISAYHRAGPEWLKELPTLIARCVEQWELTLLPPFDPGGESSWTAPVRLGDGRPAVLQLTVPTPVTHDHVTALRAWAGRGAVQLFAHDAAIRATLMEHCVPGDEAVPLSPEDADAVAAEVLPQLWSAAVAEAPDVETLAASAAQRAEVLDSRAERLGDGVDAGLFHEAARLFRTLPASTERSVLLHGDFTRRNVLRSQRGWLAIDPASMVGDPAFDAAMFLQHDAPDGTRVDALADRLGLAREGTRSWLFVLLVQASSWHASVGDRARYETYSQAASALGRR